MYGRGKCVLVLRLEMHACYHTILYNHSTLEFLLLLSLLSSAKIDILSPKSKTQVKNRFKKKCDFWGLMVCKIKIYTHDVIAACVREMTVDPQGLD